MEVSKIGDKITWNISFTNNGPEVERNAKLTDTLPAGLAYVTHSISKGTFDKNTGVATIGYMAVGETVTLKLTYIVEDIGEAVEYPEGSGEMGFLNTVVVSGDNVDPNNVNNTTSQFTAITTCPPSAGALGNASACLCGDLSIKDTLCDRGITEYRIKPASRNNIGAGFSINVDGTYNALGFILNPYEAASFEYSIWCIVGDDEFETSGPALVVIPALFGEDATDELVDNEDGTYTHTALDGTSVTFSVFSAETISTPAITAPSTTLLAGTLKNNYLINDGDGAAKIITLPLPSALGLSPGTTFNVTFKRVNDYVLPGSITLAAPVGTSIDQASTYVFPPNNKSSVTLFTDGTLWYIK